MFYLTGWRLIGIKVAQANGDNVLVMNKITQLQEHKKEGPKPSFVNNLLFVLTSPPYWRGA